MSDRHPNDFKRYGWEICDEVQRDINSAADTVYVPYAEFCKLEQKLTAATALIDTLGGLLSENRMFQAKYEIKKWQANCGQE